MSTNVTTMATSVTDSFPEDWMWVKPLYDWISIPWNRANYVVGPLMLIFYAGSGFVYLIGHLLSYCNFQLKIKRNLELGLPPPKKKKKKKKLNFIEKMKLKKKEEEDKIIREQEKKKADEMRRLGIKARFLHANKTMLMSHKECSEMMEKYYAANLLPESYVERRNSWSGNQMRSNGVITKDDLMKPIVPKIRKRKDEEEKPVKVRVEPTPEELERKAKKIKKIQKRIKREYMRRKNLGLPDPTQDELDAMGLSLPQDFVLIKRSDGDVEVEEQEKLPEVQADDKESPKARPDTDPVMAALDKLLGPATETPVKSKEQKMKELKERARLMRKKKQEALQTKISSRANTTFDNDEKDTGLHVDVHL